MEQLKVSAKSSPKSVAGALAGSVQKHGHVEIKVIGAGALNQAVKALIIARRFTTTFDGDDLICIPSFIDIEMDGDKKTGISLLVKCQHNNGQLINEI
jgi:stage V sporulation protein S